MKKIFFIFGVLVTFIITSSVALAKGNYLHTITLEENNSGYNVILSTDKLVNITRKIKSPDEIVLELSGIISSDTVNALYKGTSNIDNLVVENSAPNKLKIYITAKNIKDSSIIVQPKDGQATITAESFPVDKALWIGFVLIIFAGIFVSAKKVSEEESKILIKKDIKQREIEMYRKYRKSLETGASLDSQKDLRMKTMLKKIDRKIDERLSSCLK